MQNLSLSDEPPSLPPVLVTGGAGYVGSHAVLALQARGVPLVVLDDLSTGARALVPAGVELVEGRAGDRALVADICARAGIGAILHFAASISTAESVQHPDRYWANNLDETRALAETAAAAGVQSLVLSSTGAVYGSGTGAPFAESDVPAPENPYAETKLAAEQALAAIAAASGMGAGVVRCFNVAGADPAGRSGQLTRHPHHLIELATHAILDGRTDFTINGDDYPTPDGTCLRDYVHVTDVVDAHLLLLAHAIADRSRTHVYNAGTGFGCSVRDVLAALEQVSGVRLTHRIGPRRAGDVAAAVADSRRLQADLGWRPRLPDIETIVRHALQWERARRAAALVGG